ncbi:MAG: hypothetical protein MUF84_18875 [Anaerolineae bacterium]|jgi:hypothetical protein|nr:hypothetical protein [Anaerolineae bacterium]
MKKRLLVLAGILALLAVATGTVLAGGATNGTFVRFNQGPYYCEGYFLETKNGIVHEWRNNEECGYVPLTTETSVHIVFMPTAKFAEADCDDDGFLFQVPVPWTLSSAYVDLPDDDANLREYFGLDGDRTYWVCFYYWDTTD